MEINLNIKDRLTIVSILPSTGSIIELVNISDIIRELRLEDSEKQEIEYKESGGRITWNPLVDIPKTFELSLDQLKVIKDQINVLDKDRKIDLTMLDTCLKFSKL